MHAKFSILKTSNRSKLTEIKKSQRQNTATPESDREIIQS